MRRLCGVLLALGCGALLWWRGELALLTLTRVDVVAVTQALMAEGRWVEAADQVAFFLAQEEPPDRQALQALEQAIAAHRAAFTYQVEQVVTGVLTGTAAELSGQISGALVDLTPVGDVRDLLREGWRWARQETPDPVIAALAGVGLAASGLQLVSLGAATPAKAGLALVKTARRQGQLPGWLTQALIKGLSQARALGSLAPLQRLLAPLQTLEDQLGMTRGLAFLARTKGWQDLQEGAALAQAFGRDAPVILRLGGGGVLDASRQLPRLGVADVTAASLFGPPGVRLLVDLGPVRFAQWAARLSKIGYRQPWLRQWLEACSRVPVLWLGVLAVVGCILALPWPANWRELVIRTRS